MAKKDAQELQRHREELRIRKGYYQTITDSFRLLSTERLALLADYAVSLVGVDEEALQIAETQAIEVCGYNPTENISDHDWAIMQKLNEEAIEIEERAVLSRKAFAYLASREEKQQ